jgi:hypothetical protein
MVASLARQKCRLEIQDKAFMPFSQGKIALPVPGHPKG